MRNVKYFAMLTLLTIPQSALQTFLGQSKVDFALGHRKRATYAFAHLAPKKHF